MRNGENEYGVVQRTPPSEEKLRNTYWENTMFARLGIEALVSRLLTQTVSITALVTDHSLR